MLFITVIMMLLMQAFALHLQPSSRSVARPDTSTIDPRPGCQSINATMFVGLNPTGLCDNIPYPLSYPQELVSGVCYNFVNTGLREHPWNSAILAIRGPVNRTFHFDVASNNCSAKLTQDFKQHSGLGVDCIKLIKPDLSFYEHLSGYWTCDPE